MRPTVTARDSQQKQELSGSRFAGWGRAGLRAGLWVLFVILAYWLGEVGEAVGIPVSELVVPLIVGAVVALAGWVRSPFPAPAARASQALTGVLMGSYLDLETLKAEAPRVVPLVVVTALTIGISMLAAAGLVRTGKFDRADATLGMVPGGSAAVIAVSEDLGADSAQVAFSQYLRLALVAITAPTVAIAAGGVTAPSNPHAPFTLPDFSYLVESPRLESSLLVLAAVCLLGGRLGTLLRLPSPVLLGSMLVTVIVTFTNTWHGFAPVGVFRDIVFAMIGLEVGLRFTRPAVKHVGRMAPYLLVAIVSVCLACAGLAWAFGTLTGVPFLDSYLATTPGGINAAVATAVATDAQVSLVSTVQGVRLFIVVLAVPPMIKWLADRHTRTHQLT